MRIYPAIDIRGGKCVRLFKGDFAQETVFSDSPADMAAIAAWAAQNGILKGDVAGNANLTSNVTRGQACALAGRTMGTLA